MPFQRSTVRCQLATAGGPPVMGWLGEIPR
jgi:hypothetical protein